MILLDSICRLIVDFYKEGCQLAHYTNVGALPSLKCIAFEIFTVQLLWYLGNPG